MKKLYPALGVALAALLLAACQVPGALGVGSLKIAVPAPASLKAATTSGQGNLIRIQLVRNGVVVPLGGQNYLQQGLAGQTITVDSLPTGTNYKVYVASGQTATNGSGFFETSYFAASDPFEISAGTSTSVSVTLNATPVSIIEDSASANHAAVSYSGILYFINGSAFSYVSSGDPAIVTSSPLVPGYLASAGASGAKVYSVSNDGYGFWFNTDQGILWFNSDGTFQSVSTGTGALTVWASGAVTLSNGTGPVLGYYYGSGLTAAVAPANSSSVAPFNSGDPTWTTLTAMLSLNQGSSLQTALNKLNQAVLGVATDGYNYAYLSTGIGTIRLDTSLLNSAAADPTTLGTNLQNGNDGHGNSILVATSDGTLVGPVSTYSNKSSQAFAFAGTTKGLYGSSVTIDKGLPSNGTLPLLGDTLGLNITSLATRAYSTSYGAPDKAYTAAYSATTNEVLIYKNLNLFKRLPALAGLPSGTPQFTWYVYSSSGTTYLVLVIAGSDATVEYQADNWAYTPPT